MAKKRVAVFDFETDPFNHGDEIAPFCAGFYDGQTYVEFWGDDCAEQLIHYILQIKEPLLLYAHNGGKFDFFYLLEWISDPIKIINGRIVSAAIGHHRLRDSFSIIPVALAAYQKESIDYDKFKRHARYKNKAEILRYLKKDCEYLYSLVSAFVDRFGPRLTIGGTAISEIANMHPFYRMTEKHDEKFREFYFGGRCEVFESGILQGEWKVYDVNSMYPHVMRARDHASGKVYYSADNATGLLDERGRFIHDIHAPYFARIIAESNGALPLRAPDGSLTFPYGVHEFHATSHEIQVAIKHRLIKIHSVETIHACVDPINFTQFVETYYREKVESKKRGDRINELFAKFLLNSGYGKFAQNPAHFKNWHIVRPGDPIPSVDAVMHSVVGDIEIWSTPTPPEYWSYYDVATAASITGAARAVLLDAMPYSCRLAYCDTDSLICERLNLPSDDNEIGGWKLEATGDVLSVAGKKMYALENAGQKVKIASKGIKASPSDIRALCSGKKIRYNNPAPSFSLTRGVTYISREVQFTARIEK